MASRSAPVISVPVTDVVRRPARQRRAIRPSGSATTRLPVRTAVGGDRDPQTVVLEVEQRSRSSLARLPSVVVRKSRSPPRKRRSLSRRMISLATRLTWTKSLRFTVDTLEGRPR